MAAIESIPVDTAVKVCGPSGAYNTGDLLPNAGSVSLQQCTLACANQEGCTMFEYNQNGGCPTYVTNPSSSSSSSCEKNFYRVSPGASKIVGELGPKSTHSPNFGDPKALWGVCRSKCVFPNSSCASYTVDGDGEGCKIVLDWAPGQPGDPLSGVMSGFESNPKEPVLDDHGASSGYASVDDPDFDQVVAHYGKGSNHGPGGFIFANKANPLSCSNNVGDSPSKTLSNQSVQECAYTCKEDAGCKSYMASSDGTCNLYNNLCGARLLGEVKENSEKPIYFSKVTNTRSQACSTLKDFKVIQEPGHGVQFVADTGSCGVHGDCPSVFQGGFGDGAKCFPKESRDPEISKSTCTEKVLKNDCNNTTTHAGFNYRHKIYPCDWNKGDTKTMVSLSKAWERTWSNADFRARFSNVRPVTLQACRKACLGNKDCKTFKYWLNGGCQLSNQDCTGDVVFDDKNPIRMMADYPTKN